MHHVVIARLNRRATENHTYQPTAVALRRADQVEARGADESGFHPVGAGISSEKMVMSFDDPAAKDETADGEEMVVVGEIMDKREGEGRHVTRSG